MIPIRWIVERPRLIHVTLEDSLGRNLDGRNVVYAVLNHRMQLEGTLHRGLRGISGRNELENYVFHDVTAVRLRQFKGFTVVQSIVEAIDFCRERGGIAHFA